MPTIRRPRLKDELQVEVGANLMKVLLAAGIPVASSCGGDAVCAKCVLQVLEGAENLSPINVDEGFLAEIGKVPKNCRVSCQTEVLGDISIDARYW